MISLVPMPLIVSKLRAMLQKRVIPLDHGCFFPFWLTGRSGDTTMVSRAARENMSRGTKIW